MHDAYTAVIFIVKATAAKEQEALQLAVDEAQATNQQMQTEIVKHVKMSASRSVSISSSLGMCRSHAQHHALWVCGSCSSCNGCCCRRLTCNSPHHLHVPPRELLWRSKLPPFLQLRSKVHPALHCAKECPALLLGQLMCACVQETS